MKKKQQCIYQNETENEINYSIWRSVLICVIKTTLERERQRVFFSQVPGQQKLEE